MRKLIACIVCLLAASLAGADAGPDPRRHVTVLTWNTEHYNWERHAPEKQARLEANMFALIRQAKPDVFFIQEIYGAFDRFQAAFPEYEGRLLGRCNGLFSRFPVVSAFEPYREAGNYGGPTGGAFNATVCELDAGCVRFRMGPVTMFWQPLSVHVPEKLSSAELLAWERAPQTYPAAPRPQAVDGILSGLRACLAEKDEIPLLLAGDFNSHSHLDWTPATGAWPGHGGRTVPWDVSSRLVGAGFTDVYRAVHPDPAQDYGATFPVPGVLKDVPAPRARLDYVYAAGRKLRPVSCEVIGGPYHRPFSYAGRSFDMFPSDHAAVRAVFAVEADGRGLVRRGERRPVKVACVGDSITSGWALKDPARDAFPAQLQRILGDGYEVRNFGMPGLGVYRHTKWNGGMRAWSLSKAHPAVRNWQPDVVLCGLGINDIEEYPKDASGLFRRQYTELLAGFAALPSAPRLIVWTRLGPLGSKHRHHG